MKEKCLYNFSKHAANILNFVLQNIDNKNFKEYLVKLAYRDYKAFISIMRLLFDLAGGEFNELNIEYNVGKIQKMLSEITNSITIFDDKDKFLNQLKNDK